MKKALVFILCMLSMVSMVAVCGGNKAKQKVGVPHADKVSVVAAGDNLIHGAIYRQAAERSTDGTYDFKFTFQHTQDYFDQFDVRFINQETLVNDVFAPSHYPKFSTPIEFGAHLIEMGFNVIGISNNHVYDKGAEGVKATMEYWNSQDVLHVGLYTGDDTVDIKYLTVNHITMAFLAYTQGTNEKSIDDPETPYVIRLNDLETIKRQVKTAKENADIVIVSCHWGTEYTNFVDQYQDNIAEELNVMGVDVIIGTHPHVIQPVEWRTNEVNDNKTLICYSLGNFISAQHKANTMLGGLLQFEIVKTYNQDGTADISIEDPYFVPTITHYETESANNITNYLLADYTPELAAEHGVDEFESVFSLKYIENIAKTVVPQEFLLYDCAGNRTD